MDTKVCSALSLLCRDVGRALTSFADALSDIETIRSDEPQNMRDQEGTADPADGGGRVRRRVRF